MPTKQTGQQKAELEALQAVFKPEVGFKRLSDYGTWLFTSAAVVGTAATAFGNVAVKDYSPPGRVLLALAVAAIASSLWFASQSLAPNWVEVSPYSRDSMNAAVQSIYEDRRGKLRNASLLLAAAILFAGLVPLATLLAQPASPAPALTLAQSVAPNGTLVVTPTLDNVPAGRDVRFHIFRVDGTTASELAGTASAAASADKKATAQLVVQQVQLPANLLVIATTSDSTGTLVEEARRLFSVVAPSESGP